MMDRLEYLATSAAAIALALAIVAAVIWAGSLVVEKLVPMLMDFFY